MDNNQIDDILRNDSNLNMNYLGCFMNSYIPPHVFSSDENVCIIVNTTYDSNIFGHWILLYKYKGVLYYFDSFSMAPQYYGGAIFQIFSQYHGVKTHAVSSQLQSNESVVCGGYCIYFAKKLSVGYSLKHIMRVFTKRRHCNDLFIKRFIFNLTMCVFKKNILVCN